MALWLLPGGSLGELGLPNLLSPRLLSWVGFLKSTLQNKRLSTHDILRNIMEGGQEEKWEGEEVKETSVSA